MPVPENKKRANQSVRHSWPLNLLILGGLILLVAAVFVVKGEKPASTETDTNLEQSMEDVFDEALAEHKPLFVFLHSLDCIPCKEMMTVVAQVYPEFQELVILLDVDVYDQRNTNILRREGLQAIPTLVFYDRSGERYTHIGVMQAEQLRSALQALAGRN
jgi:thiol:disulfide interchange protein